MDKSVLASFQGVYSEEFMVVVETEEEEETVVNCDDATITVSE